MMIHPGGSLWGLDDAGRPHRLNASSEPHTDDYLDWINEAVFADFDHQQIRIQKVVATKHHIIALDRHGYCYLYVCPSHTAIRFVVSTYENQRWYPGLGWSSRTLPTDRWSFSDETGQQNHPLDSFELPSDGWKWEQPWMIDTSEEHFDKEGWQYAFNFGANVTYRNAQSAMTFVRRRRWLRARRYTALCRWVQMAITKQSEVFLDICAGGFDIENNRSSTSNGNNSSSSASDLYSFFALSLDGDLYWREGIQKNCPEGSGWVQIEPIPNTSEEDSCHEIAAISCSASCGLLIAITWNGLVFCRVGITSKCPYGKGWRSFASPCNLPVISVAMGRRALWMVTSSGRLWMTSVKGAALGVYPDLSKCITADSYTSMGDGMCRISVTNNDQVLGISQRDERMFIRSDVRDDELSGRSWLEIVARDGSGGDMNFKWRQVETGNCAIVAKRIPRHWIDKNFIARDCSATADLKSEWRQQIISLLDNRNELLWNVFQDVETATLSHPNSPNRPSESWTKTANVHASLSTWRSLNWIDCMAHLLVSDSVEGTIRLHFRRGGSFQADFFELLGAFAFCDSRWKNALEVRTTQNRTTLNIAFASEDERDQWSDILQKTISNCIRCVPRLSDRSFIWAVSAQYQPRMAILSSVHLNDTHSVSDLPFDMHRWIQQRGSFQSVAVGCGGIVWAIAQNGTAWVLSPEFDVIADDVDRSDQLGLTQSDDKLEIVLETQKYSLLSGYSTFNGKAMSKYFAWSDETGQVLKTKTETRLPNKYWNWVDSEWVIVPSENDSENGQEGWRYARKFDEEFVETKGPLRRREWRRLRVMEMPGPWIRVDAPKLLSVYVQKTDTKPMFVWAITTSGDLLCRGGVSAQNPAGDFWEEVCGEDIYIVDVCASSSNCLWAITAQNTVLMRTVTNATDITCADWHTVETPSAMTGNLKQIESGKVSVWLLTDDGELFLRLGITSKNVLGDYWYQFGSDNGAMICWISVDKNDRLYAIKKMNANKNSASFTVVRTRDFEFVNEIYRRRQHALSKSKGRSAGKNNEQPVKIEWETGMTNFGCPQISVW